MKVLKKHGVCRESFWPYRPHQDDRPKRGAVRDALRFKEKSYARILNLADLKMSLCSKGPAVCGVEVFRGMIDTATGMVPMPKKEERPLGGHAICLTGYNDKKALIKFKNSWGPDWGEGGYGWLPYEYIDRFMMDAWSSVDIDDPNPLTLANVLSYTTRVA
jgi:C1A family cysteine protease